MPVFLPASCAQARILGVLVAFKAAAGLPGVHFASYPITCRVKNIIVKYLFIVMI